MEPLTEVQIAVVQEAKRLLQSAGLIFPLLHELPRDQCPASDKNPWLPSSCPTSYPYHAPAAEMFSLDDLVEGKNSVNRTTRINGLVRHPVDAIVEYPESGKVMESSIGHLFDINIEKPFHPKLNIQYSSGDTHGQHKDTSCKFLRNDISGEMVKCKQESISCKGLKICEAVADVNSLEIFHSQNSPSEELFHRTLGFFCSLMEKGCAFDLKTDGFEVGMENIGSEEESDSEAEHSLDDENLPAIDVTRDCRYRYTKGNVCRGKMKMLQDKFGRPFIQCQKRNRRDLAHLVIRNLDEFNVEYLSALLQNDTIGIAAYEEAARDEGYGPLVPCTFMAAPSAQKDLCLYWHRFADGKLRRGKMKSHSDCPASYSIYTPNDFSICPKVFIVAKNPHSHPHPFPVKTPPPIRNVFHSLLRDMGWKMADATPRKIVIDSGFMDGLRRHLRWNHILDPSLSDLHPSLGNLDHVRRLIDDIKGTEFPQGTGFEGAQLLVSQQMALPPDEQYVRCAESHKLDDGKVFRLVICMSRRMSTDLMKSKYLSIDTSFKRLHHAWQEFEVESWDVVAKRSVVSVRAFTTSQSAHAHFILFKKIFEIATLDTGIPVRFQYIHGFGFLVWIADAHKGQALGLGRYCQYLCTDLPGYCQYETSRLLKSLDPYEHLRRFFRLCVTHFKRHVHELRPSYEVKEAMLSLSSSEPHPDIEGAFSTIEKGSRKARAWLKDKRVSSKFALPALYQPYSLIPYDVWKASPSSTNGNEQSHRNIYRDGVNLTVLAGIMRGMQFDARATTSIKLFDEHGIYPRDQQATHFRRYERSVHRHTFVQRRIDSQRLTSADDSSSLSTQHESSSTLQSEHSEARTLSPIVDWEESLFEIPVNSHRSETDSNDLTLHPLIFEHTRPAYISDYSTLGGALDRNLITTARRYNADLIPVTNLEISYPPLSQYYADDTPPNSPLSYDEDIHFSSFSTLHGALGNEYL